MELIREAIKLAKARQVAQQSPVVLSDQASAATTPAGVTQAPASQERVQRSSITPRLYPANLRSLEQNRVVAYQAENPLTAPFDILRTRLLQEMDKNNWRSLVITSPTSSCGKTLTAVNLALSIARLPDRNVVLLDFDLRKPAISRYLGIVPEKGISDYVAGNAALEDILFHTDVGGPRLLIAGNNSPLRNPAEAMSSAAIAEMLARLRALPGEPLIVVDTSPILVADDVLVLLPLMDCSLLTLAENATTAREIENSEELMANSNLIGCVLNKSKERNNSHYY